VAWVWPGSRQGTVLAEVVPSCSFAMSQPQQDPCVSSRVCVPDFLPACLLACSCLACCAPVTHLQVHQRIMKHLAATSPHLVDLVWRK
jgi:hypothetical protein